MENSRGGDERHRSRSKVNTFAVIPIFVGPLQVLLAMLPAILLGLGSALLALFKPGTFKLALRILWRMKLSVLLAAGIIVGSVMGARAVWRRSTNGIGAAEASASEWAVFRGGARRTGAVAGSPSPVEGGINWAFASEAKTFHSSPAIVGNRLYVTSAEVGVFSNRGAIYCLDADTGGVVWKTVPDGFRATFSSPAVSGKYLVTGEGLHQTQDGRISCLDVTRGGALLWSYRTKSHVESSPAIANGRAYIGAGDDGYYCFELEPDSRGNPVMVWHLAGDKYPDAENNPVEHEGRVYLGLGLGGQAVVCVDAASGRELWRVPTPFPVFGSPAIARGKVFVGMGNGDFIFSAEELIAKKMEELRAAGTSETVMDGMAKEWKTHGEVWCIDLATHQVEWRFETDRTVLGAVVAGEDRLFFGSRGGTVYSVDFNGKQIATWNARTPVLASLAVTPSHVYATSQSGRLFALDQASLQPVWETTLGVAGSFLSSPAIARGHVYVGSPDDGLLCVGQPAGSAAAPLWAGHLGGAGIGGNLDRAPLPDRGAMIWRWPDDSITAPAAAINGRLFIPVVGGARRGLLCLGADEPVQHWFCDTPLGVSSSPAASAKHVVFVDGAKGDVGRRLHFVDANTGAKLWSADVAPDASGLLCLSADAILVEDQSHGLTSFDLSGKVRWRASHSSQLAGPPAVAGSLIIATASAPDALFAFDECEGKALWNVLVKERPLTGPVTHRNAILFGTTAGIAAHSMIDGRPLWHAPVGEVKTALVLTGGFVCAVNGAGEFVLVDAVSGEVRVREAGAVQNIPPLPARGALLYATAAGLARYDLANLASELWMAGGEFGAITSPLIVAGSSVYFATEKLGFIRAGQLEK